MSVQFPHCKKNLRLNPISKCFSDPDKNATLEYYLEPNEILEVDTTNGALRLKNIWRRQLDAESRVCVSGSFMAMTLQIV